MWKYIENDRKTNADLRTVVRWYATPRSLLYMYQNKEDRNLKIIAVRNQNLK